MKTKFSVSAAPGTERDPRPLHPDLLNLSMEGEESPAPCILTSPLGDPETHNVRTSALKGSQ